ncbi:acyl-CoA thioesterase [Nevskia soli]|uniref:acyl-CoA thioesterase n=1 Tax=Nevskia soli TaxID=418856 RepID=UPI00068B4C72|nr:thioesterase family protein [Nevskia soli]
MTVPAAALLNAAKAPLLEATVPLQVPFYDCDPAGIVWHGNYAKYFDQARCALLGQIDYGYARMAESGYNWPLIDFWARHVKPLHFGQQAIVRAWLCEWEFRLKVAYLITDAGSGARLCKGHTVQVAVRIDNGEMQIASPPALRQRLRERLGMD